MKQISASHDLGKWLLNKLMMGYIAWLQINRNWDGSLEVAYTYCVESTDRLREGYPSGSPWAARDLQRVKLWSLSTCLTATPAFASVTTAAMMSRIPLHLIAAIFCLTCGGRAVLHGRRSRERVWCSRCEGRVWACGVVLERGLATHALSIGAWEYVLSY